MKIRAAVSPLMNELKTQVVYFAIAVAVVMGAMVSAPAASAQQDASQATIPFAFSANHQMFPAGHYRAELVEGNYLKLVSWETGVSTGITVHTRRGFSVGAKNTLVFLRDERGYHLESVRFAHGTLQSEASIQPKTEHEIAKATPDVTTEVAMN